MGFRYFAYGSNLWPPRMRQRCPSARFVALARVPGWVAVYDKPGADGTAKLNLRPSKDGAVAGVIWEIDDAERQALDAHEPRYTPTQLAVGLAYVYAGPASSTPPSAAYVELVARGARLHGLPVPQLPS